MKNKTKTFDCVEMKRRIQDKLHSEYESRRSEFSSYADFINKTAGESQLIQQFREKVRQAKTRDKT